MTATATALKLYRAESIIDRWPHKCARYHGVHVTWLAHRDQPPAPYEVLLEGYGQLCEDEYRERRESAAE